MHLYTFRLNDSSSSDHRIQQQQQQCDVNGLGLLNMAVGPAARCAAVPGAVTNGSGSSINDVNCSHSTANSSSSSSSSSLEFGVLLWQQLPAEQQLAWPAWTHQQQQEPYMVRTSVCIKHLAGNTAAMSACRMVFVGSY
jgi:hypothetical protein